MRKACAPPLATTSPTKRSERKSLPGACAGQLRALRLDNESENAMTKTQRQKRRAEIISLLVEMSRDWSKWTSADWLPLERELARL